MEAGQRRHAGRTPYNSEGARGNAGGSKEGLSTLQLRRDTYATGIAPYNSDGARRQNRAQRARLQGKEGPYPPVSTKRSQL
jgi:hypothetical protein